MHWQPLDIPKPCSGRHSNNRPENVAEKNDKRANIEGRLYRVLRNVAKEHGEQRPQGLVIQFPLTHEDLGFLTGAHRVTITRAMKALKKAGKIIL